MSRRMSFPLTLVGLLAAAAASAQPSAPPVRDAAWSFSVSRPTAEAPQPVQPAGHTAPAVAPPPRPKNALQLDFAFPSYDFNVWTVTGPGTAALTPPCCATTTVKAPCCEAACCDQPCPAPAAATPVRVVMAGPAPAVPPVAVAVRTTAAAYRPLGTWYKDIPGAVFGVTFGPDGHTLTATMRGADGWAGVTVTLTADCAVTTDGTVHGVITGADVDGSKPDGDAGLLAAVVQFLVDQPFAFRCRPADGGLMVSHVRCACPESADVGAMLSGRFKPAADGKVPAPRPAKADAAAVGMTLPPPVCLVRTGPAGQPVVERLGVDFHVNVPGGPACPPVLACPPAGVVCPHPVCPPGVPADSWQTLVGTFGEMLQATCPPPVVNGLPGTYVTGNPARLPCPPPAPGLPPSVQFLTAPGGVSFTPYSVPLSAPPVCVAGPCPVPCPTVTPVTFAASVPAPTVRLAPPAAPAAQAHTPPEGTWFREVGPVRMTLSVKEGTLSLTTAMTAEVEGMTITQGLLVTADCYPTRDGLVGVVTGADTVITGELPDTKVEDVTKVLAEFGKVQKALGGQPFALTCRVVGGCLMVSNVRLTVAKSDGNTGLDGLEDGSLIAGRYMPAGPDGPPKQKAVKVGGGVFGVQQYSSDPPARAQQVLINEPAIVTLPSPRYLEHVPQYFPPDPVFPLARELDIQTEPPARCEVAPEPREVVRPAAFGTPRRPDLRQFSQYDSPGLGTRSLGAGVHVECNDAPAVPGKMTVADVVTLAKAGLGDEVIVTQLRVTNSTFTLSVADLVALKRAGVSDAVIVAMQVGDPAHLTPERIHGGIMLGNDPNVRMQLLVNQSEDLRQIGREWRRVWFHDQPSHLTPERVHGGVW